MLVKSFIKEHSPATTVFNDDENANCYVCPETEGNRGVSKVVTCLIIDFALQKAKLGMKNIFSFKDKPPSTEPKSSYSCCHGLHCNYYPD